MCVSLPLFNSKWEGEHLRKAALRRSIENTSKFGYANTSGKQGEGSEDAEAEAGQNEGEANESGQDESEAAAETNEEEGAAQYYEWHRSDQLV